MEGGDYLKLWPAELEPLRAEARDAMAPFIEHVTRELAAAPKDLLGRVAKQRELIGARVVETEGGETLVLGGVTCRVFRPAHDPIGVYLHMHGGGLIAGEARMSDQSNARLSRELGIAVVSVEYRLAPEHPHPAAVEDVLAVAAWLVERSGSEFGSEKLVIGGELAGAYLAVCALLRLRDQPRRAAAFRGANLAYAGYDLSLGLPSAQGARCTDVGDVLSPYALALTSDSFLPETDPADRRDPSVSPTYADLRGLPRALFTVGSADHLLDDNVLIANRWAAAGNTTQLAIYPDCSHGFLRFPMELARVAQARIDKFILTALAD